MEQIEDAALYCRSAEVIARRIGDEMVLVPVTRAGGDLENLYALNEVGAYIWEKTAAPISLDDIVKAVTEAFEVEAGAAAADARAFLADMAAAGLIIRREAAEQP